MDKKIENLQKLLASSYSLYLKTQNYHWNVEGKDFFSLHQLFEQQYQDLFAAVDLIAERIRALGSKAYGSYGKFSKISVVKDGDENLSSKEMIEDLLDDNKKIVKVLNEAVESNGHDEATLTILSDRLEIHEKNSWMLGSLLK
jgi:starvation-inducible DNA-binding protein